MRNERPATHLHVYIVVTSPLFAGIACCVFFRVFSCRSGGGGAGAGGGGGGGSYSCW